MKRREDLGRPRNQPKIGVQYNRSAFGEFAENIARLMGTARFLIIQSIMVLIWVGLNVSFIAFRWDKYPFILLNLILSCLAALQAPVIMMSQNRQEEKDRERAKKDYEINLKAENEIQLLQEKLDKLIELHERK